MTHHLADRRARLRGAMAFGGLGLLAGCAETRSAADSVSSAVGSATSSAVAGVGRATGTRLGPEAVAGLTPSGRVSITSGQAAFIGSGSAGNGTLSFKGGQYRFGIGGAGIGGIGATSIRATGEVYKLAELRQFPGTYAQARGGVVLGEQGSGELWLQNESGVIMRLRAVRRGLMLSFGADAMIVTLQ